MEYSDGIEGLLSKFDFKSNFLFDGLSQSEKEHIEGCFEPIAFDKGGKLFYEDGIPTGVFLLEKGLAKKSKSVIGGQEQIFYIYTAGDLLGYHALLSDERYQDSCEALDHALVNFISKDNFLMLLETIPQLRSSLIRNLSHEFGVLANTISILAQKAQNIRLALFLLILDHRYNKFKMENEGISIARQDLSSLIGATRESLGRSLKEFRERGLLAIERKTIRLLDRQVLFEMVKG